MGQANCFKQKELPEPWDCNRRMIRKEAKKGSVEGLRCRGFDDLASVGKVP